MNTPHSFDISAFIDQHGVSRLQITVIILCSMVVLFDGMDTQLIGYLGPALSAQWDVPREQLGPVFSASLVGLMCGLMIIGAVSDRIGRRKCILFSVALFSFFTLLTATAQGTSDLMVYRFLAGIGLGGAMPNALALTGEYCPKRLRATLVIIMFCGFSLGSILGGLISASLLAAYGWRAVFLTGALLPLCLLPVLFFMLPDSLHFLVSRRKTDREKIKSLLQAIDPQVAISEQTRFTVEQNTPGAIPVAALFHDRRGVGTFMLWVVFFMNLMIFYFLQNWLPIIFTDAGLSQEQAVLTTTLISFGGIIAGLITGPLMDRLNPYNVLAVLYLCGMLCVAGIGLAPVAMLAVVTFMAGFCVSGAQKSVNALAVIFYPVRMRSTGVGWALGIGRFGSILGPVIGGILLSLDWTMASLFRLAAVPMLLASVLIFMMGNRYHKPAASPAP